jgi:hypothetical protein
MVSVRGKTQMKEKETDAGREVIHEKDTRSLKTEMGPETE